MASDFLVGSWILLFLAVTSLPEAIYYLYINPTEFSSYMFFLSVMAFCLGAGLLVYASYPGNMTSNLAWRVMTCDCNSSHGRIYDDAVSDEEKMQIVESTTSPLDHQDLSESKQLL